MAKNPDKVERDARNKGLQTEDERLRDPEGRPPHSTMETTASEPERHTTPQEQEAQDVAHLENPPQAEGPRERNNDAV